ncbi:MAG: bifunctional 4-hydroxy-2-oxoglutarate aldolase/2-dehydro-3-deoxy-phosphogluconate aldolase [Terrimesophilobacter sp.]
MTGSDVTAAVLSSRIVAIVREKTEDDAKREAKRLVEAGLRVIEVSLSTPNALGVVRWLNETLPKEGTFFGAGTVLNTDDVKRAAQAGARFIVSPVFSPEMIDASKELHLVSILGAFTPNECLAATSAGADFVKLFPASLWDPSGVRNVMQALPILRLIPTGGVRLNDAAEWMAAGAVAVGLGGTLRSQTSAQELRDAVEDIARPSSGV